MLRFSTDGVPSSERVEQFRDGLRRAYFDLDVRPLRRESFEAGIRTYQVSSLFTGLISGSAQTVLRPATLVRGRERDGYFLNVQLRGHAVIEQCNRRVVLEPGHAAFVHGGAPFRFHFPDAFAQLSLHLPESVLPSGAGRSTAWGATLLSTRGVTARMLVAAVSVLAVEDAAPPEGDALTIEEQLLAMLHASLARSESTAPVRAEARLLAWIERHADDPLVCLDAAVSDVGLSRRTIQYVFQRRGDTFSGYIRRRRVERAKLLLRDHSLRGVSILDLALQVGFADLATFCRAFRAITGQTASAYRRAH